MVNNDIDVNDELDSDRLTGLSDEEVKLRVQKGKSNVVPKAPSRTISQIIRANLFTLFNAINLVLAVVVIIAGSPKNSLFAGVIITNTLVGVVQELRAKATLEKLSVLNMSKVKVLRNKNEKEINLEDVVIDDLIILVPGMQLVADCIVIDKNEFEADESMLTGESDSVIKKSGDELLSGSFIVGGNGYAKVIRVGKDTYAAKLAEEARKFKKIKSELQTSVNQILKIVIWLILPISILLITTQILFTKVTWQDAVISAAAGIVGMIPEGLVLLTSLTFVVGIVRLSKWKTLVQELPATEVLARVDVLCLDKTGTITEGKLNLEKIVPMGTHSIEDIENILAAISGAFPSTNPTQQAILDKYSKCPNYKLKSNIPFSSARKWSGVEFENEGAWVLGAPEMILNDRYEEIREDVEKEAQKGRRVLLLASLNNESLTEDLPENIDKAALLLIEDIIRKEAPGTLEYFRREGVEIKIISGDNPVTVAAVAKRAGVFNAESYIDARILPENQEELAEIIENNTVFGRVTPHQKKALVNALKSKGHTVGMTGDGVNDVLALKESDCGIAMASGSDAAKAVSQLVLLDSNFSALPEIVLEGRRMINNLENVSNLYLTKTVYSILLSLIFGIIALPYPMQPIQLSLIGAIAIGLPSFFLALGPNKDRVKSGFLERVLSVSIVNGCVITLAVVAMSIIGFIHRIPVGQSRTLAVIIVGGISLVILTRVSYPLNGWKLGMVSAMIGIFSITFIFPITRRLFSFSITDLIYIFIAIFFVAVSWPLINLILEIYEQIKNKRKLKDK